MPGRELSIRITGDSKDLSRALGSASKDVGRFGKQSSMGGKALRGLGLAAGGAAVLGVAALGKTLFDGVQTAIDHEKALAQTNAVIKSTGGGAKVSAAHILTLSDKIEKMSGIDDLATQAGENMLLTFTNIKNGVGAANKIFDQATIATANLSTALGKDMKSSALLVGKALNDPIKGVTALTRAGVQFSDGQKEAIKAMVESGNTAGAQKIILKELETQFGGSAKAAGGTMAGQLNILKAHFEDLQQNIGQKVLPVLNQLIAWAITNWPTFQKYAEIAMQAISDAWNNVLKPVIDAIVSVVGAVISAVRAHWDEISAVFEDAFNIITGFIDAFVALFKGDWSALWKAIKQIVSSAFDLIVDAIKLAWPLLKAAALAAGEKVWDGIKEGVGDLKDLAVAGLKALPGAFIGLHVLLFNAAVDVAGKIWDGIKSVVKDIAGDVKDYLGKLPDKLRELVGGLKTAAGDLGGAILDGIGEGLKTLGAKLATWLKAPINAVIGAWNAIEFSIPGFDPPGPGPKFGGATIGVPNVPLLARGGIVTSPTLAMIGESGPEAVVPLGGGGVGTTINVTVQGSVVTEQELAEKIRNALIRTGRNTTRGALGGYA